MERHHMYQCGNNGNPRNNKNPPGGPLETIYMDSGYRKQTSKFHHGAIFRDRAQLKWNRARANYRRNEYPRHQVYWHVEEQHCHESRQPHE